MRGKLVEQIREYIASGNSIDLPSNGWDTEIKYLN